MKKKYFLITLTLILIFANSIHALEIERRREQFLDELAYMIYPLPYSLPGIGSGLLVTGYGGNVFGTYADANATLILGDAQGSMFRLEDIHLLPKRLILDLVRADLSKVAINNYTARGMNTDKDSYNLLKMNKVNWTTAKLTLTFYDRMFEVYTGYENFEISIEAMLDHETEEPIAEFSLDDESTTYSLGTQFDYTDDYQDPRKGVRLNLSLKQTPRTEDKNPDYYSIDYSATFYYPVGKLSTLAFNYFRSDAYVNSRGETDSDKVKNDLNIPCDSTDQECLDAVDFQADNTINANTNGSSATFGGENYLRSYAMDRFKGAHSEFLGLEYRWNLTDEFAPFDYYIWKDVRTGVQLAFFGEVGSIAENWSDLWKEYRTSYGMGLRMITGSGIVYRFDMANGDEGLVPSVIFSYPW